MTALSSLLPAAGGGKILPAYLSGRFYPMATVNGFTTANASANRDYLFPFTPIEDVTIDNVGYVRANTTAGNVYVGIYEADGTLRTDCAVHSTATTGLHEVSTTAVALTAGTLYYLAFNQSAAVVNSRATDDFTKYPKHMPLQLGDVGFDPNITATYPNSSVVTATNVIYKARTAAALQSSLTMTGFTGDGSLAIHMGFTKQ